jgi:hypothetical protein
MIRHKVGCFFLFLSLMTAHWTCDSGNNNGNYHGLPGSVEVVLAIARIVPAADPDCG